MTTRTLRRRLVADPALIAPAIEELLRFNTSAQRFKRVVMRPTSCMARRWNPATRWCSPSGREIATDEKFPEPDTFDIDRRPLGHLGFGSGKHFCLGSQMARLVTEISMRRFLERVPDYHLTVDKIGWNSSSNFRSPTALPFAQS